jgi:hypothetical protein
MSANNHVLALTALTGSSEVWTELNDLWLKALAAAGISPPWHTTEFVSDKELSKNGIPKQLVNVLGLAPVRELKFVSAAIDKTAAQEFRGKPELRALLPSDAEMCVNLCFKHLGIAESDAGKGNCMRLIFDQKEPFINHLKRHWLAERKKSKRLGQGWAWQTHEIEPAAAIDHPGIQMADLIVWVTRSTYEYGDQYADPKGYPVFTFLLITGKHLGGFLDREKLADLFLHGKDINLHHHYSFMKEPSSGIADEDNLPVLLAAEPRTPHT